MFVDRIRITVKAGDGGDGCMSFRREKNIPFGGPNGGDGGSGGNILIVASTNEQSLVDFKFKRFYQGERGEHGRGSDQHGKCGKNLILKVPVGTIIKDLDNNKEIIFDLDEADKTYILAKGGRGGRGNIHFATSTNRAPRKREDGKEGETKNVEFELKTIADAGLVGYPNAGKSTFLGSVSSAKPKVAAYPFTTLHPMVGTIDFPDYFRLTIADIPGLIEGAHDNIGLGHSFLKHIERTKVLVYVLDMSGREGRDPHDDFLSLQNELELYMKGLSARPFIVLANKMDLPESEDNLASFIKEECNVEVIPISAADKVNLDTVLSALKSKVEHIKSTEVYS